MGVEQEQEMARDAQEGVAQEARAVEYDESSSCISDTSECHDRENESHAEEDTKSYSNMDGSIQNELRIVDGRLQVVGFTKHHSKQRQSKSSKSILKRVTKIEDKLQTPSSVKSSSFWKNVKDCFF
jgi:hypothetical protein